MIEIYTVKVNTSGSKFWYQDDELHRTDGPAVECASGTKYWYIKGKEYTKGEFDAIVNVPKVKELTMSEISKLLGYEVKVVK